MNKLTALISALTALLIAVGGILTVIQGQSNKTTALRNHDRAWVEHRHATKGNVGSFDKGLRTDMATLRESIEQTTKDTGTTLVQPTTVGRMLGEKPRLVPVKSLRPRAAIKWNQ